MNDQNLPSDTVSAVPDQHKSGRWFWALSIPAVCGLCLTGYLAWAGITASGVAGCGAGDVFNCEHVMTSHWSKIMGVPVGVPAFALYCTLLSSLVFSRISDIPGFQKFCWASITVCGVAAGLAGIWFSGLQFLAMEHLCPWCLSAHTCSVLLLILILWKHPLGIRNTTQLAAVSVGAVGLLVTIQSVTPRPALHIVERFDGMDDDVAVAAPLREAASAQEDEGEAIFSAPEEFFSAPDSNLFESPGSATSADTVTETEPDPNSGETSTKAAATLLLLVAPQLRLLGSELLAPQSTDDVSTIETEDSDAEPAKEDTEETQPRTPAPKRRLIGVTGNRFRLDVRQWPLLGKPDARYVFVEMFDYTCQHCRNTNRAIQGAFRHFGDDLAVITLPVPLDRKCNPSAQSSGGQHRDSCEISRIAVAVWRIDPAKFHRLHDWIMQTTRTARSTRQQAEQLVGREALEKELKYPTAGEYIAKHVQLYKQVGAGSVPKLMFPNASMVGEVNSTSVLCRRIERELASTSPE